MSENAGSELLLKTYNFINSIDEFSRSQMYQMYRFVPSANNQRPAFGPSPPREINEISLTMSLASSFRDALISGDRERAVILSAEINSALINWLLRDAEMENFSRTGFFRLLLILIIFIIITAIVIRLLHKSLMLSLEKEAESSMLNRAFLLAQEEERGRISRELHDTVAQDLRGLSLGMERIGKTADIAEREKLCEEAASIQSEIISRIRNICDYLVPPDFRFQGLPDALKRLCLDFGRNTGIDCRAEIMENLNLNFLDEEKQLQVFRIIQEALNNIKNHAQAGEAIVVMRSGSGGNIFIGISDDGIGFKINSSSINEEDFKTGHHMGIKSMKKRAAILGGKLEIRSENGEGTLVCLELPVQEEQDKKPAVE